jgi:glycosyltransferase involved in cell wall biosynthesis
MHPYAGGPPVVVERLCLLAPSLGWDASIITTSLYCDDDGSELENFLGRRIDVKVLPVSKPRFLKRAYGASDTVDEGVRAADIVHLHTLWHPLNAIARKACVRHGRKYVMMPHGMLDPYALSQKRWRKKVYLAATERRILQGASLLIFTTFHERQAAQESLAWLGRDEIIPLGADRPPNMPRQVAREAFINSFPQVSNRRCVLFLGRIHPKKGLDRVLNILPEIVRRHPSVLLVIAGDGEPSHVRNIQELVYATDLSSHVLFTGMVGDAIKWSALACAEVFVLPSRQENFAISVAEAMHSGVPVVITKGVDSWPFVKKAQAGFVIEEDKIEVSFAKSLHELLSDPAKARRMGMLGQEYARERLSWERVARDMFSMYDRLVTDGPLDTRRFRRPAFCTRSEKTGENRLSSAKQAD